MRSNFDNLLILDDEVSIRQSIAAYMEDEGYTVFQAGSGEEALEIVKQHPIRKVIVDIRLPGMDGNTFMIEARKIRPEIDFIIHTGSADYLPPPAIRDLGVTADKILIKPAKDLRALEDSLKKQT